MPPQVATSRERVDRVACDALVVGAFEDGGTVLARGGDAVDSALDGALSEYLADVDYKARVGATTIVPTLGRLPAKAVAVVGLGPRPAGPAQVRKAAGAAGRMLAGRVKVASALHMAVDDNSAATAEVEGLLLGSYQFGGYRSTPSAAKLQRILSLGADDSAVEHGSTVARAVALARDLANEPASALGPDALARRAAEMAEVCGLECEILDEEDLAAQGFGGILGVAQGSERPPRLIKLRYAPPEPRRNVALVGKGITFDSGGLSIKDARSMEQMKTDMAGGAAVIGAMSALSKLQARAEVVAYVPATDNMPGGGALRPGDVITHYGGRTSEVLNTDAEGRLVLADALAHASRGNPDALVDIATLTGAISVALGNRAAGLFANDDALAADLQAAAHASGERLWHMPLYEDYRADLDSEVADIKNTAGRFGGAIYAALFLRDFIGKGVSWAHMDIAGAARAENAYDEITKGASGSGTRTLIAWIEGMGG